jgi:hypothetical protein
MVVTIRPPAIDPNLAKLRLYALKKRRELTASKGPRPSPFDRYRFDPLGYIVEQLDWTPWRGTEAQPGQADVLDAYTLALRQQFERRSFEHGEIAEADLVWWHPGQVIQNRIRVEAGHTVGKTMSAAGIVSHFFDCFLPGVGYCFAPSDDQINDLLFKEIRKQRRGKPLPGRVLEIPEIKHMGDHFVKGRATSNARGKGTERVQGQHEQHLIFILDEAEGIEDYVWDALESMTSGGIVIVVMLANPRTRISRFHKAAADPRVRSFRISCLWHPNVLEGREVVPGAVRRDYVDGMIDLHCQVVPAHNDDEHTFEVPWRPGLIFAPDTEMLFRVLGIAPKNLADNTLIPVGRYEAAKLRVPETQHPEAVRIGVDCARFGKDSGTIWVRHDGAVSREATLPQQRTGEYIRAVKAAALRAAERGATSLHVRVDGGGGFGGGVIDGLLDDLELSRAFVEIVVIEVHFNGTPSNRTAYADLATELYAESAEAVKGLAIVDPPDELEADLCERTYRWANWKGYEVKELESKDAFKKRHNGRSPDDGDGFVLAVAPDFVFFAQGQDVVTTDEHVEISPY